MQVKGLTPRFTVGRVRDPVLEGGPEGDDRGKSMDILCLKRTVRQRNNKGLRNTVKR